MISPFQAWAAELSEKGTLSFVLENDLFYNLDQHYTNGARLIWVPGRDAATPAWATYLLRLVPWIPESGEVIHGYAIGQSMYTPRDITIANPPLRDRPYAGWLYGTVGIGVESGQQLDWFEVSLGMVGPASRAEQTQKFVHKLIGSKAPQGWSTQLKNEPGLVLNYQRSWRSLAATTFFGHRLDFTPHVGATLGNIFTYADTGFTIRYGKRLPNDFGPPRIQPGILGSGNFSSPSGFGWYLFAGVEERAVARNIFLDGNTFRASRRVQREPFLTDIQYGFVVDWPSIRLSYTHVLRSREFRTQSRRDDFGAITMSVKI
jgi:hypothetical protein